MDNPLIIILAVFVGISAIALCIQAGMLFGIYKSARSTEEHMKRVIPKVEIMLPKVEALVESSTAAVDMSRKQIQEITAKAARLNVRIYEVGISYNGRTYAEGKKIGWRDGFRALWCILKYNFLRSA